jgi:flagellar P-ring protein precursor FlgI
MSPLKGADGQIYGIAQGNVVVGGLGIEGEGSQVTINVPSVGRIPNGASVERSVATPFGDGDALVLNLRSPDFTTAQRLAEVIELTFGPGIARALDAASVRVLAPRDSSQRVGFVAALEALEVLPGVAPARVIVNARTGTVVIGENVTVLPAAVSHGSLTVSIAERPLVSQPNTLANGETVAVPRTEIRVEQQDAPAFLFGPGVTLQEIVNAINKVGASPGDLVAILEALRSVGALRAELIII